MATGTEILAAKGAKIIANPAVQKAGMSALKAGFGFLKTFAMAHPVFATVVACVAIVTVMSDD